MKVLEVSDVFYVFGTCKYLTNFWKNQVTKEGRLHIESKFLRERKSECRSNYIGHS